MADKLNFGYDERELNLGASFTNNKSSQYHTIKYDFKPASVDVNKMATVDVGTNNQVTVTVPHLDGAGVPQTVFKGSQRPYTKECVLIIDRVTGEITLEKLSSNIQVKKTRQETTQKPRPLTPVTTDFTNTTQRSTSRTRVATNRRSHANVAGPAGAPSSQARFNGNMNVHKPSPNLMRSPPRVKTSPPQAAPWSGGGNSTLASLPMIGLDDLSAPTPAPAPAPSAPTAPQHNGYRHERPQPDRTYPHPPQTAPQLPQLPVPTHTVHPAHTVQNVQPAPAMPKVQPDESSSSSSSDSDSNSGSDSDSDDEARPKLPNGVAARTPGAALPADVLNDDLCLSESGSDSD